MKGTLLCIPADGSSLKREELTSPPDYLKLREVVGGYIETVPFFDKIFSDGEWRDCVVFCNEEHKIDNLSYNKTATRLWQTALKLQGKSLVDRDGRVVDYLGGSVAVIIGDKELLEAL